MLAILATLLFQAPTVLDSLETAFDSTRYLADQLSVTRSRSADRSIHGVTVGRLEQGLADGMAAMRGLLDRTAAVTGRLDPVDRRAYRVIAEWHHSRGTRDPVADAAGPTATCPVRPAVVATGRGAVEALEASILACYTEQAGEIVVAGDTLDRLSVLARLGTTDEPGRREQLFRALDPVWSSINGRDEPDSPYRTLIGLRRAAWAGRPTPMEQGGVPFGLSGAEVERWLVRALEAWRATLPDSLVEPWDYYHRMGAASRRLSPRVPRDSLLAVNRRFYRALGADPDAVGVRYDLEPRRGKYPVAFTDFGARARRREGGWAPAEPWVFASYRIGGFDNLAELLHETGHAVHIAAIRTRPAFNDWPDSDPFTEGIADLATLELYEPAWQVTFLGDSAPLAESLRARYAGIIHDVAWALFELRVHRAGAPSPNEVWNGIMERYFRIRPHPELSWWAMRGQLIDSPGYLLNYALGAFIVADLRDALRRRVGPISRGRESWYREVSAAIYRFGGERPAAAVVEEVLGRSVSADALLADLGRIRSPRRR